MMSTRRSEESFTIVEGLVVLAVIAVVATFVLANLRFGQKKTLLDNEALRFAQVIQRAKTNGLGAVVFQGSVPQGGYGVRFDTGESSAVVLFADRNDNAKFNGSFSGCTGECVERIPLQSGVVLSSLSRTSPVDVTFQPPDPTTRVRARDGSEIWPEVQIVLSFASDTSLQKTIIVRDSGEILVR